MRKSVKSIWTWIRIQDFGCTSKNVSCFVKCREIRRRHTAFRISTNAHNFYIFFNTKNNNLWNVKTTKQMLYGMDCVLITSLQLFHFPFFSLHLFLTYYFLIFAIFLCGYYVLDFFHALRSSRYEYLKNIRNRICGGWLKVWGVKVLPGLPFKHGSEPHNIDNRRRVTQFWFFCCFFFSTR